MTDWPGEIDLLEPFIRFLGVESIDFSKEGGVVSLKLEAHHVNRFDFAHGGVAMTLLDFVMAQACRAADRDHRAVVTVEIKTAFLRPARGTLRCTGRCIQPSGTLAFGEGRVEDESGDLVAYGSGTFKFMKN